jgi:protein-disulfide isomerase
VTFYAKSPHESRIQQSNSPVPKPLGCEASLVSTSSIQALTIDGKTIETGALPDDVRGELFQIKSQSYIKTLFALQEFAARYAIEAESSKSFDSKDVPPLSRLLTEHKVSEEDVKNYFAQAKTNYPDGTTLDSVANEIRNHLQNMRIQKARDNALLALQKGSRFSVLLRPPCGPAVDRDFDGFPKRGKESGEGGNTLVEVVDYFCAQCRYLHSAVTTFADANAQDLTLIQVVSTANPDSPQAEFAAGAYCAQLQGNEAFWKYHEAALQLPESIAQNANARAAVRKQAIQLAKTSGIETIIFGSCLDSGKGHKMLKKAASMLETSALNHFPSYAANGHRIIVPEHPSELKQVLSEAFSK